MVAKWGTCAVLALCLILGAVGCRTTRPDVKPAKTAERLVDPPKGTLDTPEYPKQAFDKMEDTQRQAIDLKNMGVIPTRGAMMPGGQGMSGGMSGPGGR